MVKIETAGTEGQIFFSTKQKAMWYCAGKADLNGAKRGVGPSGYRDVWEGPGLRLQIIPVDVQ